MSGLSDDLQKRKAAEEHSDGNNGIKINGVTNSLFSLTGNLTNY